MDIKELTDLKWYKLSLDAGAVIHESLQSFLIEKNLNAAYVLSCVGHVPGLIWFIPRQ
jgi:hypothetical protein